MKKLAIILMSVVAMVAMTSAAACGGKTENGNVKETTVAAKNYVEVIYFHGKQRCATCRAIEQVTREVVEQQFAEQVKNGTVKLRIVDISDPKNEQIADKYEIAFSSLLVVKHIGQNETVVNLTDDGFSYARNEPETFKKKLTESIKANLQ